MHGKVRRGRVCVMGCNGCKGRFQRKAERECYEQDGSCASMHLHAPPCTSMHLHAPPCTSMRCVSLDLYFSPQNSMPDPHFQVAITAAVGFDSFVVMRHGAPPDSSAPPPRCDVRARDPLGVVCVLHAEWTCHTCVGKKYMWAVF